MDGIGDDELSARSPEYRRLVAHLRSGREDSAYQGLAATERRVLDTVDRVVNDARRARAQTAGHDLLRLPLHVVIARVVSSLRGLFEDLVAARTLSDAWGAVSRRERLPYYGVTLIAAALVLMSVDASV